MRDGADAGERERRLLHPDDGRQERIESEGKDKGVDAPGGVVQEARGRSRSSEDEVVEDLGDRRFRQGTVAREFLALVETEQLGIRVGRGVTAVREPERVVLQALAVLLLPFRE